MPKRSAYDQKFVHLHVIPRFDGNVVFTPLSMTGVEWKNMKCIQSWPSSWCGPESWSWSTKSCLWKKEAWAQQMSFHQMPPKWLWHLLLFTHHLVLVKKKKVFLCPSSRFRSYSPFWSFRIKITTHIKRDLLQYFEQKSVWRHTTTFIHLVFLSQFHRLSSGTTSGLSCL